MANVIHRTTLQFLRSVNDPDYPEPTWKHNPDMSAVAGVPNIYWKAPADWNAPGAGPVEMTAGEKAAVDTAILEAARDGKSAQFDDLESEFRQLALATLGEVNRLSGALNDLGAAIVGGSNLSQIQTAITALGNEPTRTIEQLRTVIRGGFGS